VPRALFGASPVLEAMHDVHAATGETVSISTKNDIYLQYVQIIQSVHQVRFHVDEGTLRPLTQSAVGWTLLSTMADDKIDNILRRANIATEKPLRVKLPDLLRRVHKIRETGFCSTENIPFLGGGTICVLLPIQIQDQPAVLGLGGAAERIRKNHDTYLAALQRAAKTAKPTTPFDQPIDIDL
jgi:DNA-binding IclR family transcriptional regulator